MTTNLSLFRSLFIYHPYKWVWLVILTGYFSAGCHRGLEVSQNGFQFERFPGRDTQSIQPGKIVLYKYFVSETKAPFPTDNDMVSSQFRMVSADELSKLQHPIYDVLHSMRIQDTVCIHYEKDPLKKYPKEYGDGKMVYLWVTITDVLSEEDIIKKEQEKRESILKDRENYFAQLSTIDSLVKQWILNYKERAVVPDTTFEEGFILFNVNSGSLSSATESKQAMKGDVLRLNYAGYDEMGTRIFSSYESREPYITSPGSSKIPPGWSMVLTKISGHQSVVCRIPSKYLYGDKGFKGNVEVLPGTDLWFYFEYEIVQKDKK